jgi:hypothetical protein
MKTIGNAIWLLMEVPLDPEYVTPARDLIYALLKDVGIEISWETDSDDDVVRKLEKLDLDRALSPEMEQAFDKLRRKFVVYKLTKLFSAK